MTDKGKLWYRSQNSNQTVKLNHLVKVLPVSDLKRFKKPF